RQAKIVETIQPLPGQAPRMQKITCVNTVISDIASDINIYTAPWKILRYDIKFLNLIKFSTHVITLYDVVRINDKEPYDFAVYVLDRNRTTDLNHIFPKAIIVRCTTVET
ncbi:MAG TPA: hypothetical protein PLC74_13890, partial [Acetobacteraceae bacterium]|nr:hypothetical protein [Acetobacteraceae bacterium]